mmetsp:Transcript_14335/g.22861  ORF Transcript_14335/g.22861 Transcript_14335/m.22861 type:complete len:254 (-) Transcript_14335:91-852(-)
MSSRLVFCDAERAVPCLSRGWRTPDPSPTRNAADLPKCKPSELKLFAEDVTTPRYCQSKASQGKVPDGDRTLSPPMVTSSRRSIESCSSKSRLQTATPSPTRGRDAAPLYLEQDRQVLVQLPQALPLCGPCIPQLVLPGGQPTLWVTPFSPISELDNGDFQQKGGASHDEGGQPTLWVTPFSPISELDNGDAAYASEPSVGSRGHPYTCAEACKYMSKKRGCKDGVDCDRCHLCPWKPVRNRKAASRLDPRTP